MSELCPWVPDHGCHWGVTAGFSFSFQSCPELVDEKGVDDTAQTPTEPDLCYKTVVVEKVRAWGFPGAESARGLPG